MKCASCGKNLPQQVFFCETCLQEISETITRKRNQVVNDVMEQIDKEANEAYAKDPTRGRGRGPKWMDG